jgi:hypothetical protein
VEDCFVAGSYNIKSRCKIFCFFALVDLWIWRGGLRHHSMTVRTGSIRSFGEFEVCLSHVDADKQKMG